MRFTPFQPEFAPQIAGWFSSEEEAIAWGGWQFGWPIDTARFEKRGYLDEVRYFSLVDEGEPVGFVEVLKVNRHHYRLCRVAVSPAHRGRKLSAVLVSSAINYIRSATAAQMVSLAVFRNNLPALSCYRSLGFKITDKEPKMKVFSGQEWPLYQMELSV